MPDPTPPATAPSDRTTAAPPPTPAAARRARAGDLEDRVWAALRRHPGSTTTELADLASASRSAVGKLLAAWAADGSATATAGPKPRDARRWTAAPADLTPNAADSDHSNPTSTTTPHARPNTADTPTGNGDTRNDGTDHSGTDASSTDPGGGTEPAPADEETRRREDSTSEAYNTRPAGAIGGHRTTESTRHDPHHATGTAAADAAGGDHGTAAAGSTSADNALRRGNRDRLTAEAESPDDRREPGNRDGSEPDQDRGAARPQRVTRNRSGSRRLPRGGLRGQVEDYLADTPGEHSPVEIGKVLGRSAGAIANALEALVESGNAVRTLERPRRYSHPDHADAVEHRDDGDAADNSTRPAARRTGRGVCGVGTYVTVLAVLPLDAIDAISTDEIANWVRATIPAPVLFAAAAHGVTRAALSAGANPDSWPSPDIYCHNLDNPAAEDNPDRSGTDDDRPRKDSEPDAQRDETAVVDPTAHAADCARLSGAEFSAHGDAQRAGGDCAGLAAGRADSGNAPSVAEGESRA